ncbi:hypothetical protein GGR57DRAFT_170499 [Xylariaceae sp. FL1272]|nr:hypothetical protein GGR57DRAFT_170499 [Xylariaceae sp. FL1272]
MSPGSFRRKVSNLFKRRGDGDHSRDDNIKNEDKERGSLSSVTISPPIISLSLNDRTPQGPQGGETHDGNNQRSSQQTIAEAQWRRRTPSVQLPPGLHLRDRNPRELQRRFGLEHCKALEKCARCGNWFTESHNSELACTWHPDPAKFRNHDFMAFVPPSGIWTQRWSCCNEKIGMTSGCVSNRHVAKRVVPSPAPAHVPFSEPKERGPTPPIANHSIRGESSSVWRR